MESNGNKARSDEADHDGDNNDNEKVGHSASGKKRSSPMATSKKHKTSRDARNGGVAPDLIASAVVAAHVHKTVDNVNGDDGDSSSKERTSDNVVLCLVDRRANYEPIAVDGDAIVHFRLEVCRQQEGREHTWPVLMSMSLHCVTVQL